MNAVDEVLKRIEQQKVELDLPDDIRALELLQMAYRSKVQLSPQQARCAIEALPYETPKLSASTVVSMDGQSFAEALERATARSETARNGSTPLLNGPVEPLPAEELKRHFQTYRRF